MTNTCHGCKGNGWVSPNGNNAVLCPVCSGSGVYASNERPKPFVKDPFTIKPFKLPPNPYQPSPYFYGPSVTCGSFLQDSVKKTAKTVIEELNKSIMKHGIGIKSNVSI